MSSPDTCPNCGSAIPAGSPEQLCPKCMLLAGLESQHGSAGNAVLQATVKSPAGSGFVPPTPAELASRFPQLEILDLLGRGGMGAVYKARQPGLDRLVAVKILPPEVSHDPAFAERFTREARALARLSHPHIVAVYDFGQTSDGLFFFVMEYVDGINLRQAIRNGAMPAHEALSIVPQICDALQFAHDEGVVHRDIKPENILLDRKGRVKIADFGLAKLVGIEASDSSLTGTQQVMGTLKYMAPEQMERAKSVDHRADIYSLGVVFYELLTGELPIGRFAPPSKRVQIDVRLDEIVLRALEREPDLRWQHASDVKSELEVVRTHPGPRSGELEREEAASQAASATAPTSSIDRAAYWLGVAGTVTLLSFLIVLALLGWGLTWARPGPLLEIAIPFSIWSVIYSIVSGLLILQGANELRRRAAGFAPTRACILAIVPFSPAFVLTLPIGIWVWTLLSRPDVHDELARVRPERKPEVDVPLEDRPFYVAGQLTGMLLRQKWFLIIGQVASAIAYVICLFAVFTMHATMTSESYHFEVGAPGPWLIDEVTSTNSRMTFQFLTWAYVPAALGLMALGITRWLEQKERGKVHSMWWHYGIWIMLLALTLWLMIMGRMGVRGGM